MASPPPWTWTSLSFDFSLPLYHSLFGSAVPYTHFRVGLNIKFKEVMQTRWNSHPWPKYYPEPFNYPPCFPLSPFLLPFLSSVRVLSLRSSNCSLEIQRTLMTWGQKTLKYQGQRVQHSGALLHTHTHTYTNVHPKYTRTHKPMKDGSRKQWEQVPLVYFLCVPNVGPGGGPQLNHSRHAVEWEATTLTSLKGAIETHTHTHTGDHRITHTRSDTHIHTCSAISWIALSWRWESMFKKWFEVKGQICMGCFPQCFARQLHNPINVVTTAQLERYSVQAECARVRAWERRCVYAPLACITLRIIAFLGAWTSRFPVSV